MVESVLYYSKYSSTLPCESWLTTPVFNVTTFSAPGFRARQAMRIPKQCKFNLVVEWVLRAIPHFLQMYLTEQRLKSSSVTALAICVAKESFKIKWSDYRQVVEGLLALVLLLLLSLAAY